MISADDRHDFESGVALVQGAKERGLSAVLFGTLDDDEAKYVIATSDELVKAVAENQELVDDEE